MIRRDRPEPRNLDTTVPATLAQYVTWLDGFIKQGGIPTHFYGYPYERAGFVYALSNVMVDSDVEFGAWSRRIIVPRDLRVARTASGGPFDGWGHTSVFLVDGYRHVGDWVPAYSNPEFEPILTEECREEQARQEAKGRQFSSKIRRPRREPQDTAGSDGAVLRMLGGASFGPGASLVLPSGTQLDADEAQAFTSLYADDTTEEQQ